MSLLPLGATIRSDLLANAAYPKSAAVLVPFRVAAWARSRPGLPGRMGRLLLGVPYKIFSEWLLGIELPASTQVGPGLRLRHGVGVVINPHSVIGANVMIRHGVTLGNRRTEYDCPTIGDHVEIGAGAIVIGDVIVGHGARIGAGAVVTTNVPAGALVLAPRPTIRNPHSDPGQVHEGQVQPES